MKFRQVYFMEDSLPDFVEVSGKKHPTKNELGDFISSTIEGVISFWKWFGDSKTVDSKGRPKVFYHQSQTKYSNFSKLKVLNDQHIPRQKKVSISQMIRM